jgi:hypothetical protein
VPNAFVECLRDANAERYVPSYRMHCNGASLTHILVRALQEHKELWSQIDLVAPNYLGSTKAFMEKYAKPIKLSRQRKANELAINFGDQQKHELDKLLNGEVFLKRNKKDVLSDKLPLKLESVLFCQVSALQLHVYQHVLGLPDFDILIKSNAPCDCGVNKKVGSSVLLLCASGWTPIDSRFCYEDFRHVSTP